MSELEATIEALVRAGDFKGLAAWCDNFELDMRHPDVAAAVSLGVHKVHLLAHLLLGELELSRFVWKRLPEGCRSDAEMTALWEVGKMMWLQDHAGVQAAVQAHSWSSPLIEALVQTLRARTAEKAFRDVGTAYSSILPDSLAAKLGLPVSTVHELAAANGWASDSETGAYKPVAAEPSTHEDAQQDTLQQLTDFVARLERDVR